MTARAYCSTCQHYTRGAYALHLSTRAHARSTSRADRPVTTRHWRPRPVLLNSSADWYERQWADECARAEEVD